MSGELEASDSGVNLCRFVTSLALALILLAPLAHGQTLAVDDTFSVPYSQILDEEAPGVLANDTFNGEPAEDHSATATLVVDATFGALSLGSDGSFTYDPYFDFPGVDSFTYEAAVGTDTDKATVTLTACSAGPGPTQTVCWMEAPYLTKIENLGYQTIQEGFEDAAAWDASPSTTTREPDTAPSALSQGIIWRTNHPDPPASNEITTGTGPARTGIYGVFDPLHGYAIGIPAGCDVNSPDPECLYKDGFTGASQTGENTLYGIGGHFMGSFGPNLVMILNGGAPIGLGVVPTGDHQFFGVIDSSGFNSFRVEETDGKVGQIRIVFADDFTIAGMFPDFIFFDGFESGGTLAWSATYP